MLLLSCRDIKKSFADLDVLQALNLEIHVGERIGLVGVNGAGKSTLANIIYGDLESDAGVILQYRPQIKMGYLLQSKGYKFNERSGGKEPGKSGSFFALTKSLGLQRVQEWEAERFQGLSGGERTKLALAEIWAERPDFLILDEPTNHLDFLGVEWLVKELQNYRGTVLIISHDRYFLDQAVERIVEIDDGQARSYAGNYSFYRAEKQRAYENQLQQYYEQKKKEEKIEVEMERLKQWSAKAHREAGKVGKMAEMRMGIKEFYRAKAKKMDNAVKSRMKRLERMREDGVEKPKDDPIIHFLLQDAAKHGRRVLEASRITKQFGDRVLFRDSSFYVTRGEKVGLLGPNGCGKTTLIKMILGEEALDTGEIWVSPSSKIGYLSQDVSELNAEQTVLEVLGLEGFTFVETARTVLASVGIDESMVGKRVKQLSMGERLRVKLAQLILDRADLLILDEPTNHLDLSSREELEQALTTFEGTMLIVSHDRYMLEKLCNRLLVFANAEIRKFEGGFSGYQQKQAEQNFGNLRTVKEELMVIENRLTVILSRFGRYSREDPEYLEMDAEYHALIKRKGELKQYLTSQGKGKALRNSHQCSQ